MSGSTPSSTRGAAPPGRCLASGHTRAQKVAAMGAPIEPADKTDRCFDRRCPPRIQSTARLSRPRTDA